MKMFCGMNIWVMLLSMKSPFIFQNERNFHARFIVYSDLRERGFLVKTGFKFGCDFRVYERGVKLKKGPKEAFEHTKWVVHAIPEEFSF
jgi:tRNA-intron endonuclease